MVFIGWFLLAAGRAEASEVTGRAVLAGVTVGDVMTAEPAPAPDWIFVDALIADYFLMHQHGSCPVRDMGGRITGLITLNRLRQVSPQARATTRVREVACAVAEVPCVTPQTSLLALREKLGISPDRRALVFEGDALVGIVSPSDLAFATSVASLRTPHARAA